MDALLFAFVAAALAGVGDQTQSLAASLSARSGRPALVLTGLAIAAIVMAAIAYIGGSLVQQTVGARQQALLLVVALAFAGFTGLTKPPASPRAARFRGSALLAALLFGTLAATGGRIQYLTLAFAGRVELPILAAIGGGAGLLAAATPAALLGEKFRALKLRWARLAIAMVFMIAAALVYLNARPPTG